MNIFLEYKKKFLKYLLTLKEKNIASSVYKLIKNKKQALIKNEITLEKLKKNIFKLGVSDIDYIQAFDINKLAIPYKKSCKYRIFFAYYLGSTRLIDNI